MILPKCQAHGPFCGNRVSSGLRAGPGLSRRVRGLGLGRGWRKAFPVRWLVLGWLAGVLGLGGVARAELQFDVFLGYGGQPMGLGGVVREAGWFAVGCEIFNDGPGFDAVVELLTADGTGQRRRFAVELPTNTRKRFVIPVFASGRMGVWEARLVDARGKVRAEYTDLRPRALAWEGLLVGAVPRTYSGAPILPDLPVGGAGADLQPLVARLPVELMPDEPIALEGLDALYLSSEKALELRDPQVEALESWVYGGGHLILAVEQTADVSATRWLRALLPCAVGESSTVRAGSALDGYLRYGGVAGDAADGAVRGTGRRAGPGQRAEKYRYDPGQAGGGWGPQVEGLRGVAPSAGFDQADFLVAGARVLGGRVELEADGRPLVVTGVRGRGHVTVLLFSPEREPFRSWEHREWFWARLVRLPASWVSGGNLYAYGGDSVDGVVGAMIDSRQIQKLPVRWLLLLLVGYLVVIGPLDQYVLKRLKRQMLTWVTFPTYVVLFSLLIYYIGYRLRAGETEWNELHVVDVVPRPAGTDLRGRTYASLYSPANARYRVAAESEYATLRSEFLGSFGGSRNSGRLELDQQDHGFAADVFVPVWTSQLVVCDWLEQAASPLEASIAPQGPFLRVAVTNRLSQPLQEVRLVLQGRVHTLGPVPARGTEEFRIDTSAGRELLDLIRGRVAEYRSKAQLRQHAFGSSQDAWLALDMDNLVNLSFLGLGADAAGNERQFLSPPGMDLKALAEGDMAVVVAWVPAHAALPGLARFRASRGSQNTLLRLAVPLTHPPRS